jgi:uncharacterized SAM-binding protein YcdF (DUF218 family)
MAYDVPHDRRRTVLRFLWLFVLLELIVVGSGLAIAVQAGRSDAAPADAALVLLNGDDGDRLRLDRAQQVWANGVVSRIVVAGRDVEPSSDYLLQQGVQPAALLTVQAADDLVRINDTRRALDEIRLQSVIVIAKPSQMLRMLKMVRDSGLQARSLPVGTSSNVQMGELVLEVGRYFRYVIAGR